MYSILKKEQILDADLLVSEYLDVDRFIVYCKQCANYGNKWSCPDLGCNIKEKIKEYNKFIFRMTKVEYDVDKIDYLRSQSIREIKKQSLYIESRRFNEELLLTEKSMEDAMAVYSTTCILCDKGSCTRPEGKPCRHPESMRWSIEAIGVDVTKLAKDLFAHEIVWERNGILPNYYTLAGGVFFK